MWPIALSAGTVLIDEKLGLHIAFGRSDHFGGSVGPLNFNNPNNAVHIDHVYIPEMQSLIEVTSVVLLMSDGEELKVMEDGEYAERLFN